VPPNKTLGRKIQPAKSSRRAVGVSRLSVKLPSAPLPDFVEPMKAQLVDSIRPGDWIYEIKFDGYRALALRGGHETRILSRNQKDLGKKFPEITSSITGLDVQDAIIDGEMVALDDKGRPSFQLLQGFDMGLVRPPIVFYAFDLLRLNGKDLQNLPIEERKAKLEGLLKKPTGVIRYSVSFTKDVKELLSRVQELGLEGLIGKAMLSGMPKLRSAAMHADWQKITDPRTPCVDRVC
jgi:bifunctional non-homologous end joining protein LigD